MFEEVHLSSIRQVNAPDHVLRFGVPNQGRLLHQTRLALDWPEWDEQTRRLGFTNGEVEILLARSTDLPRLASAGAIDGCVTGRDYVVEAGMQDNLEELVNLKFQEAEICVIRAEGAVPDCREVTVVSQYPNTARRWLNAKLVEGALDSARFIAIDGAAEMYIWSGMADLAIDAVMTGQTLRDNALVVHEPLFRSAGCVFSLPSDKLSAPRRTLMTSLSNRLASSSW